MSVRWEYRSLKLSTGGGWWSAGMLDDERLLAELNRLGEEGWELVSSIGRNGTDCATREMLFVLKRVRG
jgi:hypothetical protein